MEINSRIIIENDDLNDIFVTGCHHFGHENIIKYCNRPFQSTSEMDLTMIGNWNGVVGPGDLVFHLGDFTLGNPNQAKGYFKQLNGDIRVLSYPWHHDKYWLAPRFGMKEFEAQSNFGLEVIFLPPMIVLEIPELAKNGYPLSITLCHYPFAEWDRKHYGAWHLHSHSHGNHRAEGLILDMGVDCTNFYPLSLKEIAEKMTERNQ